MKIMTMALMKMMRCAEKGEMAEMMNHAEMAMMNMMRCAEKRRVGGALWASQKCRLPPLLRLLTSAPASHDDETD